MKRFKLGIDLATRRIGVCILDENNNFVSKKTIELDNFTYDDDKLRNNVEYLCNALYSSLYDVYKNLNKKFYNLDIGIEVSNYGNPNLANKFNFYAGAIYSLLYDRAMYQECETILSECSFKFFNANQWEFKCGSRPKDERDRRKKNTRKFVMEHCNEYDDKWSEDECDAYCIAYWLDELKNTDEIQAQAKQKVRDKNKKTWILYSLGRKLNSRLAELAGLDKVRNARRIETVKRIIENIKKEIEDVKKKTSNSTNLQ